ncbi:MAG TPA: ferrous iron transport protein B [Anaerolineales bacterium]|nr:ferrous iron transport protein B [Anaerolineales bacterium]
MSECHPSSIITPTVIVREKTPLIALAGQPNVGKSTLFNLLTGLNQHVGNWPGKTVERREGSFTLDGRQFGLVDLPGTYSLTANSPEEVIAREFILREQPDIVVAVVNAASLERSLYLVAELVTLPAPVIVALNMMDVAEHEGIHVEAEVLEAALGIPVMPITATRTTGTHELLRIICKTLDGDLPNHPRQPEIRADHLAILKETSQIIAGYVPDPYPDEWVALKLLEGDAEITRLMQEALPGEKGQALNGLLRRHDDALLAVASGRYEWIERMVRAAVVRPKKGQVSWTNQIDAWATHPIGGLLILAGILGLVFWLTFTIGSPLQGWLDTRVVGGLSNWIGQLLGGYPLWLKGLVVNGILGGAGAVITFLPIMVIFFAAFGLLEDTGYMARAAYVMDNLMHMMGLHGKSFLPLFLGFGCNVPAVMGTRVIDSKPARLLTILIAPLVPCTARMAVVAFLAPAFFGPKALLVSWLLILLSMFILVLSGTLLNKIIFKGQRSAFIMEMPLYHLPNARTIGLLVWQRSLSFIKKAGSTILAMAVAVWVLSVLPNGDLGSSYLVQFGKWVAPVGQWMGLDWRLTVALITSFPAKENAIATMGVLFGSSPNADLAQILTSTYSTASALSFLVVTMLFIPCMATVAVIRQETNSWGWTLLNIGLLLAISIAAGGVVYHLALFLRL